MVPMMQMGGAPGPPMPAPPAGPGMDQAIQSANPMSIAAQPVGVAGPTPEDTSDGIIDQLKTVVQASQTIAASNPQVADIMDAIQKLCIQAALKTQQQGGGNQQQAVGAPTGY